MLSSRCAVFIVSCDATRDVSAYCLAALSKYWDDAPFEVLLGTNTVPSESGEFSVTYVPAQKSNWRLETLDQLSWIRQNRTSVTHLLVLLDDFILQKPVSSASVIEFTTKVLSEDLKYLRLKRLDESWLSHACDLIFSPPDVNLTFPIPKSYPYPSALQISVWDIQHFERMVSMSRTIWDFEKCRIDGELHHAVGKDIFTYTHIVEKGQWDFSARRICVLSLGYFHPGSRSSQCFYSFYSIKRLLSIIAFPLFGYLPSKIRACVSSVFQRAN